MHSRSNEPSTPPGTLVDVCDIGTNMSKVWYLTYPVAGHDMQVKGGANRAVFRFCVPVLETIDASSPRH